MVGSPLDVIASGPTAPDPSTWADAAAVLARRLPAAAVPPAVAHLVARGVAGAAAETPKPGDPLFAMVENRVVADNTTALGAAAAAATRAGLATEVETTPVVGEARDAGRALARLALAAGPGRCLVSGGETTVTVTGAGRGGRSLELALAFALAVEGRPGITLLAAGSDGRDGPTDAAGAVVTGGTVPAARARGLDPEGALAANDAYTFFAAAGGLLLTGPTGTNVMDLQIVVTGPDDTPTGPLTLRSPWRPAPGRRAGGSSDGSGGREAAARRATVPAGDGSAA